MFISDFIKELEELKSTLGDVRVLMRDEYGNEDDFDCFGSEIDNPFDSNYGKVVILEM